MDELDHLVHRAGVLINENSRLLGSLREYDDHSEGFRRAIEFFGRA